MPVAAGAFAIPFGIGLPEGACPEPIPPCAVRTALCAKGRWRRV